MLTAEALASESEPVSVSALSTAALAAPSLLAGLAFGNTCLTVHFVPAAFLLWKIIGLGSTTSAADKGIAGGGCGLDSTRPAAGAGGDATRPAAGAGGGGRGLDTTRPAAGRGVCTGGDSSLEDAPCDAPVENPGGGLVIFDAHACCFSDVAIPWRM